MRRATALLAVGLLLLSAVAPAMAASTTTSTPSEDVSVNYDADGAPNPYIDVDAVTVAAHDRDTMDSALQYESNSGDIKTLPAMVNQTNNASSPYRTNNPYSMVATDIEWNDASAFPHGKENVSAIDASEWSKDMSSSAGSATISDSTTAPGVDAVSFSTSGQTSGDTAKFTFSNFSVTSDAQKRYLQVAADINSLDSGTSAELRAVDADLDHVSVDLVNQSANETDSAVVANATGEGDVLQVQLGSLAVEGSGDGTLQEIQQVQIVVSDGNLDADISALNAESLGEWTFGEERVDTDSDDELETESIMEPHGRFNVYNLSTMGPAFDNAVIHSLEFPAQFRAQYYMDSEDGQTEFIEATNRPGFAAILDHYKRISLPAQYDLSYSGTELVAEQSWISSRYVSVETKEAVGSTDFGDIDGWTTVTDSFDSEGDKVTLDSTVGAGTEYALHYEIKLQQGEVDTLKTTKGGGPGVLGGGGGGFFSMLVSIPGMIVTGLAGFFGGRKAGLF
jgi:hypothetical protein